MSTMTSTTGEKCARCGDSPERVELTPGDGFCVRCFNEHVDEQVTAIKAEADALSAYINNEDPHAERISDEALVWLNGGL